MENTEIDPLANPVWHALSGPHARLGKLGSLAACFNVGVAPFAALREPSPEAFAQLAALSEPGRVLAFFTNRPLQAPADWLTMNTETLEQYVCEDLADPGFAGGTEAVELGTADVPAMLALTAATEPGPFGPETIRCGRYLGVRATDSRTLVAMAGERLRTASAVEVSAVCTAASHRGLGLGGLLVCAVASHVLRQQQTPFLHVRPHNTPAMALYEKLGFRRRRTIHLALLQPPMR